MKIANTKIKCAYNMQHATGKYNLKIGKIQLGVCYYRYVHPEVKISRTIYSY